MKKIIINLKRRTDRKESFLNNNPKLKDFDFLEAFDSKNITHHQLLNLGFGTHPFWKDPHHNRKITSGEVGCAISHMKAWKLCAESDSPLVIFEDDAVIVDKLFNESEIENLIGDGYNIIYLSHIEQIPDESKNVGEKYVKPKYPYNLHSYVVTPEAARILLSMNFDRMIIPADDFVARVLDKLNPIAYKEDVAVQLSRDESISDVEYSCEEDFFIDFNIHPLTVGTDRKKCIPLNDSGARMGIYPKNLGSGDIWQNDMSSPAGGRKINLLKEYIADLPDNDVVLFTDAYDVFYADDLDTITRRFLGFNSRILFSAEQYIWPDKSLADKFPESETKYRYLNSGTFIAEVGELKKVLDEDISDDEDDQLYYQKKFLSGEFDIKLDYEGYIFITHEEEVRKEGFQLYNPATNTMGCVYHGNGGNTAKIKFKELYKDFFPKLPTLYLPVYNNVDVIDRDMLVVNFMAQSQCEDLISIADRHGGWENLEGDKFPALEIRMSELGLFDEIKTHWEKELYPVIEKYWYPIEMYGLRDAFVMRYSIDTQTSLTNHHDASHVTGSVKLNDDYVGAELKFSRQNISNKDIPVGRAILFPGMVTHGHECTELESGVKYSLTMWTKRHPDDN
jgi:GR25 family glycosyltransferase involved in LPS biosynthesis